LIRRHYILRYTVCRQIIRSRDMSNDAATKVTGSRRTFSDRVSPVRSGPARKPRNLDHSAALEAVTEFNSIPGTHWTLVAWATIDQRGMARLTTPSLNAGTGQAPSGDLFLVSIYKEPGDAAPGVDTVPTFRLDQLVEDQDGSGFSLTHVETVTLFSRVAADSAFNREVHDLLWHASQVLKAPLAAVMSDPYLPRCWTAVPDSVGLMPVRKTEFVPVLATRASDGTLKIHENSAGQAETVVQVSVFEDEDAVYNRLVIKEDDGSYAASTHAAFIGVRIFVGSAPVRVGVVSK